MFQSVGTTDAFRLNRGIRLDVWKAEHHRLVDVFRLHNRVLDISGFLSLHGVVQFGRILLQGSRNVWT